MPEIAFDVEAMKKRFNELVWECCPPYWTAEQMEITACNLLQSWQGNVEAVAAMKEAARKG